MEAAPYLIKIIFKKTIDKMDRICYNNPCCESAAMAQMVERVLGKDEVTSSILVSSSRNPENFVFRIFYLCPQNTTIITHYTNKNGMHRRVRSNKTV